MNILTTRFGLIQACESDLILVPEGLLGFRAFTHYIHLPDPVVRRSVVVAERDGSGPGIWAGRASRWRSATTGSSFARATGRHSSWKTNDRQ